VQWASDGSDNQKWIAKIRLKGDLIDNLLISETSFYNSWGIDSSAATGDLVYGDRDATYTALPAELEGAETILTACDAKGVSGTLAEFTAGDDISVYVALDNRVTAIPSWLSGWEATGLTAVNSKDVTFNLYKMDYSTDETVTLGENGQSSGCVNYTVFAVKSEEPTTPEPTTEPTTSEPATGGVEATVWGDANDDGDVLVNDVVLVMSYAMSPETSALTPQGLANADVYQNGDGVAVTDAASIQKFLTKLVSELPES